MSYKLRSIPTFLVIAANCAKSHSGQDVIYGQPLLTIFPLKRSAGQVFSSCGYYSRESLIRGNMVHIWICKRFSEKYLIVCIVWGRSLMMSHDRVGSTVVQPTNRVGTLGYDLV